MRLVLPQGVLLERDRLSATLEEALGRCTSSLVAKQARSHRRACHARSRHTAPCHTPAQHSRASLVPQPKHNVPSHLWQLAEDECRALQQQVDALRAKPVY
jgi:hypothetical protein